jgi:hypothetical protein
VDRGEPDPIVLEFDQEFGIGKGLESEPGGAFLTRWQSSTWFVQTVIVVAPRGGAASLARW